MVDETGRKIAEAREAGHPVVETVEIDSALATALLKRNVSNRDVRKGRIARYREDMEEGHWTLNGGTIVLTNKGEMIDGQHRLLAIQGTDLRIPMIVVYGVDPSAQNTIDQGLVRTAGDYLKIEGVVNGSTCAKIVRLLLAYDRNGGTALKDTAKPTNAQVLEYFHEHHDEVEESAEKAFALRETAKALVSPAVLGFCHALLHKRDPEKADVYIQQIGKGEEIAEGQPAFAVRTRLLNMGKTGAMRKVAVILAGWNAFMENRELRSVRTLDRLPSLR